jgi:hypothetical protein
LAANIPRQSLHNILISDRNYRSDGSSTVHLSLNTTAFDSQMILDLLFDEKSLVGIHQACQCVIRQPHINNEVTYWKYLEHERCIAAERHLVPEDKKSIPEGTEEDLEYKNGRKPAPFDNEVTSPVFDFNTLGHWGTITLRFEPAIKSIGQLIGKSEYDVARTAFGYCPVNIDVISSDLLTTQFTVNMRFSTTFEKPST